MITEIEIDKIISRNILQDRESIEVDDNLIALANSIEKQGLIQPIVVKKTEDGDRYRVVCGQRRIAAFNLLQKKSIPAIIKEFDSIENELSNIIDENKQRKNLNPFDKYIFECKLVYLYSLQKEMKISEELLKDTEALSLKSIKYIWGLTKTKQKNEINNSDFQSFLSNCEQLNIPYTYILNNSFVVNLDDKIKELLKKEKITIQIAKILHKEFKSDYYEELIAYVSGLEKKVTVSQVNDFIKSKNKKKKNTPINKERLFELIKKLDDNKTLRYLNGVLTKLEQIEKINNLNKKGQK